MKTQEQIETKVEQLKTDFIESLAFDSEKRALYSMVYKTLMWVLRDKEENIDSEGNNANL